MGSGPVVSAAGPPQPPANELSSLRDEGRTESLTRDPVIAVEAAAPPVPGGHGLPLKAEPARGANDETSQDNQHEVKPDALGRRPVAHEVPKDPESNPLLLLPDKQRARIFAWIRNCPYLDASQKMLESEEVYGVTAAQITEFNEEEAKYQQEMIFVNAARDANSLVALAEKSDPNFSGAILTKLGQEVFRLVSSGQLEASAISRLGGLFLKARGDDRVAKMQGLKREKLQQEMKGSVLDALEHLSKQVRAHPEAQVAFQALCEELNFETEEEA
jgi:hypothetical protein